MRFSRRIETPQLFRAIASVLQGVSPFWDISDTPVYSSRRDYDADFADVRGQQQVKRAIDARPSRTTTMNGYRTRGRPVC